MHDGVGHDGLQVVAIYVVRRHDSGTVEDDVFDHLFIKRGSAAVHHILRRESHERCLDRAGREEPLIGVVPHTLVRGQVVHDKAHLVTRIVVCRDGAFHIGDLVGGQGARDAGHRIEQVHVHEGRPMLQPMLDRFENPCHNSLSDDFASPLRASGSFRLCSIP